MSAFDNQVGGNHYKNYKIQPMEFFIANNINYPVAAVIKYVMRYKDKNGIEDLNKAIHIIEMLKEELESETPQPAYIVEKCYAKEKDCPSCGLHCEVREIPYSSGYDGSEEHF